MWHDISNYQINKEGVILGHVGYGPIGMILVWPSALFLEDSEPGGPMIRAFPIGLKKARYSQNPSSFTSDTFQFEWFNLYLDPCFTEIMNLSTNLLDSTYNTCYTQNNDGSTRRGWATFSKWDGLTCTWTCFSRRIQI